MKLLQEKLAKYDAPQRAMAMGIYPYFREIQSDQDTEVLISGKKVLMFGSNAYLGLTNHPKVKEAAIEAIKKYGTGCAGSRFLNGTLDLHLQLEKRLAEFVGKEDAIVYSTGFQVNLGVVSCITGREDYILWDELDHASIIEGHRLSFSTKLKFKHNDMDSLEKQLQKCEPDKVKLIVIDGVFSMEGDVAKLPEIVALAKKYNASVMVDEAHGIGVFGDHGRGTCNHFGVTNDVDLIMGTFSKSFGCVGGFVAASEKLIQYLRYYADSNVFSAAMTPQVAASSLKALELIQTQPEIRKKLWANVNYLRKRLTEDGFDIGCSVSAIFPIMVRDNRKVYEIARELQKRCIFVSGITYPAVRTKEARLRISVLASHEIEQLEQLVTALLEIRKSIPF